MLGCGPAGLFAAQAVQLCGYSVAIISKKVKSNIYGAQYLHKPIPELTPPDSSFRVQTIRYGRAGNYARRVYGNAHEMTSWDKAHPEADAWDLRETYDAAWEKFEAQIADEAIDYYTAKELAASFPLVISTIPAWTICGNPKHQFPSKTIMVKPSVEYQMASFHPEAANFVIYNGTDEGLWYRCSQINGFRSTEAIAHPSLVGDGWDVGFKIVDTDCDCLGSIVRAGRMGEWRRGVLTHHAFEHTITAVHNQFGPASL